MFDLFLGCVIPARLPYLEASSRKIFEKLGIELHDVDGFSCCPDPTGIEQIGIPVTFKLGQNYPNPFNSETIIPWQIAENSKVTLTVLDIVGRTVEILVDERRPSGNYETKFNAGTLPKGIYFYQLKAGENIQTRKMILLE